MAPIDAPSALATIRSIANGTVSPTGDCMTTTVAIAAQYASGNPTSRPSNIEIVAATAVRKACDSDGRFSLFQLQSFINESSSSPVYIGKITIDADTLQWRFSQTLYLENSERTFSRKCYLKIRHVRNCGRVVGPFCVT